MKHKEVVVGESYILQSKNHSNPSTAEEYFDEFLGKPVQVLKKFMDYHNKNSILIRGQSKDGLIDMWCSPYDLKEIDENE